MAAAEFARTIEIAAPLSDVYALLAEPENYVGLQPLLVDVREQRALVDDGWRRFRSTERVLLFGFLPYRNSIAWGMKLAPAVPRIDFETRSFPRIELRAAYSFGAAGHQATLLTDSVSITCPAVLRDFVLEQATRAHEALLRNVKERFGGAG